MWIWEQPQWPDFTWNASEISEKLRMVRFHQGILLGKIMAQTDDQQTVMLDTLLANIVHSSAIEGEKLNAYSVRSSLANRLGLSDTNPFPTTPHTDGLADIMLDAVQNLTDPLSLNRILQWHSQLFSDQTSLFGHVHAGALRGEAPMQVVSGRIDQPIIHFQAPDRSRLEHELTQFIHWFNHSRTDPLLDPLLRAALTHLWFVTLHPLDDGNGRITRLLTDLALAQAENQSVRFYAMSVSILNRRQAYYNILEQTQKGDLDITHWILWFLDTLDDTFSGVLNQIDRTLYKSRFWHDVDQTTLSREQTKVLNRMLDGDFSQGINASQYQKVAKVSRATATRHLTQLVALGCLTKTAAGGRSTRYILPVH